MKNILFAVLLMPALASAQDAVQVRKLFENGQYQQAIDTAGDSASGLYFAAQSHQKLGEADQARATYERLAALPEEDVWHFIGLSGEQLLNDDGAALESAQKAVDMAANLPESHFQLGLVLAKRQDWKAAADAFDKASELNPGHAYAHYYGGLMQYRAGRPDRMANHFEQFLKLAPDAPERPEVLQIMRTVRGR